MSQASSDGAWIQAGRKNLGWTQGRLGDALGVSQATISHWERGRGTPRDADVARMQELFGSAVSGPPPSKEPPPVPVEKPARKKSGAAGSSEGKTKKPQPKKPKREADAATGALGFEDKLWKAADLLRTPCEVTGTLHPGASTVSLGLLAGVQSLACVALGYREGVLGIAGKNRAAVGYAVLAALLDMFFYLILNGLMRVM